MPSLVQAGLESNVNPAVSIRGISSDSRNVGFESASITWITTTSRLASSGPRAGFVIDNAAKARIDGAEVEIAAQPVAGFDIAAGIGYNQAAARRVAGFP